MTGKDLHDAVAFVGQDLIDLAETQTFGRSPWQRAASFAACLAILLGISSTALPFLSSKPEPSLPTRTETTSETPPEDLTQAATEEITSLDPEKAAFFARFPDVDPASLDAYWHAASDTLSPSWNQLQSHNSHTEEDTLSLFTTQGDPILAIDAVNGILLIETTGKDYRGVLAIAEDPTRLSLQVSSQLGLEGETVGTIAQAHNGILAMTGSPSLDSGSKLASFTMCDGISYLEDTHMDGIYQRLEITQNGSFRFSDSHAPLGPDTQNALEGGPVLIQDGTILVDSNTGWNGQAPRACIGQTQDGRVLMLVIEGRQPGRSLGTGLVECASILSRYGGWQALNLDGGSSAVLWYNGVPITSCSNVQLSEGRPLPSAFVYARVE